jgi:hypothetical protein
MRRRWRLWRGALSIGCALGALAAGTPAAHAEEPAQRVVLGTLRVSGSVESTIDVDAWRPTTGGAVVEAMAVRTGGEGSVAVAQMTNGDLIGLAANSLARFEAGSVYAEKGKIAFRLRPGSSLEVTTPRGVIRAPGAQPVATGGQLREGMITVTDEGTTVQGYRGTSEMTGPDGEVILVETGQIVTFAADSGSAKVRQVKSGDPGGAKDEGGGYFGWFPSILGLTPTESAALVGIGVGLAGGAAGASVAATSGDDDGDGNDPSNAGGGGDGGGGDAGGGGSPFRTR